MAAEYDTEGCLKLVGEILSFGAMDPSYFRDPCAVWWATLVGLDPKALWEKAVRRTQLEGFPYSSQSQCAARRHTCQVKQ